MKASALWYTILVGIGNRIKVRTEPTRHNITAVGLLLRYDHSCAMLHLW